MSAIKEKTSHIDQIRKTYELDQQFILRKTGLNQEEYNNKVFETGCHFVELEFSKGFKNASKDWVRQEINKVLFNKKYWQFFQSEWKAVQSQVVKHIMADPSYFAYPKDVEVFNALFKYYTKYFMSKEFSNSFYNLIEKHF